MCSDEQNFSVIFHIMCSKIYVIFFCDNTETYQEMIISNSSNPATDNITGKFDQTGYRVCKMWLRNFANPDKP